MAVGYGILSCTGMANAQLSLTTINLAAPTIDFSSTITGVSNGAWTGSGFQSSPTAGQLNSNAWAVTGWSDGALAFGGTRTTSSTDYVRGSSGAQVTTGGMYNFSAPNANTLGFQSGASDWAPGTVTLKMQNNTTTTILQVDIAYDLFVRNDQARSNSFNFSFSSDDITYTPVGALDITSTAAADALGFVQNSKTTSITGLSIPDTAFFFVRWSGADVGGSGSRDEFALDNISVTPVPEPTTLLGLSALGMGVVGFVRRTRRKA